MLDKIDLSHKVNKTEYKQVMPDLEVKLATLQREAIQLHLPILIVFEGWEAAGKGTLINHLILSLDPRHFKVYNIKEPNEEEHFRPFLWRFWIKIPATGRMAIFDHSWYRRVLAERVQKTVPEGVWKKAYGEINYFERQLYEDGNLIVKFFLHISKKEQKKRFEKLQRNPATSWRVTKEDWTHHKNYQEYFAAAEEMLAETDTSFAPWTVVEAHDRHFASLKIFKTVISVLENRINSEKSAKDKPAKIPLVTLAAASASLLDKVDLSKALSRKDYSNKLKKNQKRIRDLEYEIYRRRIPVLILYEGWDAAGKGGNIKRLTQNMDPRGYEVIPIAAPNDIEKKHHYLWRFWNNIPKAGHITIFDRTWYGRVLVERVEGFAQEDEWKRAYREINETEEQLTNFGTVLVKFWLQIDREEQLDRFQKREKIPHKRWKITEEDWRNREKWDLYKAAVDEMLLRTSTLYAPWTIVESNSKYYARVKTLKTVIAAIEKQL